MFSHVAFIGFRRTWVGPASVVSPLLDSSTNHNVSFVEYKLNIIEEFLYIYMHYDKVLVLFDVFKLIP